MTNGPSLASTAGTAGQLVVARLAHFGARIESAIPRVLAPDDAGAVHDLRVAVRRTRTLLAVGRPVLGRFHADEVRRALRETHRTAGALRDEEVLIELVTSLAIDRPDVHAWLAARARRERSLRAALRRRIREGQLDPGRRLLGALLAFRVNPSKDKRVAKFARRAVADARREVERRRTAPVDDDEALHRLRLAHKSLRYTVETFADALPSDVVALGAVSARIQSRLGDLHDAHVAIGAIRRARSLLDDGRLALLAALEQVRAERVRSYLASIGAPTLVAAPAPQAVGAVALRKTSTR